MKRLLLRGAAAVALFALLAVWRAGEHPAFFPNPLTFDLVLEPGEAGRTDPVIVSGVTGAGDFLSVRFADARTVRFLYDSWGVPGLVSAPITIERGTPLRLTVEMPGLDQVRGVLTTVTPRVRVVANGTTLLEARGQFYAREPKQIYFGHNPIGGTACSPALRGRVIGIDGRPLDANSATARSVTRRLRDWSTHFPQQVAGLALLSLVIVFLGTSFARLPAAIPAVWRIGVRHRWFVAAAAVASLGYAWLVTLGTFRFNEPEVFGSFYDYQAASLLAGRLDVPEEAIGGEAFEARGKFYGYFGPTPAVLRMPFTAFGVAFGKLSRGLMLAYFIASLVAAYLILREAQRAIRPTTGAEDDAPLSAFAVLVLVGSVGWGSTIFFLGSRGLIFHEAILAGIAFALWSVWCSLRHLRVPTGRWWIGALTCGVASVHARPPTGLFALTLLGLVAIAVWWRSPNARWTMANLRRPAAIGSLCALGFLSLNGLAWLKFRTFDPAPLRLSRPYADPGRLAHIDGKSFHLVNLPYNFDTYVLRPNFRFERGFPWIYLGSNTPRRDFPQAKIDLPDFTLAVPYAMPSLFLLATLGAAGAWIARPGARLGVALLWVAVLPMTLALFAAIATAQRYTGDFCPFLIGAAAFGLAAAESAPLGARRFFRATIALATLCAIAVTVALTIQYQGAYLWGVPEETRVNYQSLRRRVDAFFGAPLAPLAPLAPPRTDVDR